MATVVTPRGTRLHCRTAGNGSPPVLFVHGWCGSARDWDAQFEALSPHHQLLAVDRPGMGLSQPPVHSISTPEKLADQHSHDLLAVMDTCGIDRAVVVAHAGGAATALNFACRYQDRIRGLVLVDTRLSGRTNLDQTADGLGGLIHQLRAANGPAVFETLYRSFFPASPSAEGQRAIDHALERPMDLAIADLTTTAIDTIALARTVHVPVLWLASTPPDQDQLSEIFADVEVVHLAGACHFPHIEQAQEVNQVLMAWLSKHWLSKT